MECIDFCLFGVYGVDRAETILVEQPDNCRKGCPACSRVCPENAIIFPQHKSPAIAGAPVESGGAFKIDLSKLFGAPDRNEDPAAAAARERDEQLILAGRSAVGNAAPNQVAVSPSKTNDDTAVAKTSRDALDSLIDQLDSLDL
jgi:ferredoxin